MTSINTHRLGQPSTETSKAGAGGPPPPLAPAGHFAWWYRATVEERLAQIDGAIDLGLTAKHVAINCGLPADDERIANAIRKFAYRHGRSFPDTFDKRAKAGRTGGQNKGTVFDVEHGRVHRRKKRLIDAQRAYEHGEPVDFWSVE